MRDWCVSYRLFCREKYFAAEGRTTVTFYGGAEQVCGSCAIVENGGTRILADCGTFYGDDEQPSNALMCAKSFGFDPARLDAMVLSHAHQDHLGRIPKLV